MNRIDAEIVRKIKSGSTTKEMLEYYQMDEDFFMKNLEKSLSRRAFEDMKRTLKKNDKNAQKSDRYKKATKVNILLPSDSSPNSSEELKENKLSQSEIIKNQIKEAESNIQEMINLSSEYEKKLIGIEISIKENNSQMLNLQSINKELSKEHEKISKDNDLKIKLINERKERLSKLKEDLKNLEKVLIYFNSDGEIEIEDPSSEKKGVLFAENKDVLDKLLITYSKELETYTLKIIKSFASLIGYVKRLKNSDRSFEIAFEDDNFEKIFSEIIN